MAYAEQASVVLGLRFKTPSGLVVKTTGKTVRVESNHIYVHELEIMEGTGEGVSFSSTWTTPSGSDGLSPHRRGIRSVFGREDGGCI